MRHWGSPLATHKWAGPTTSIIFGGIEIDTVVGQLRFPARKLARLMATIPGREGRRSYQKNQLQSLIGLLNHACKVVRPGRSFLRRMIDLLTIARPSAPKSATIRLNAAPLWNGTSFLPPPLHQNQVSMNPDVSGLWECGAWRGSKSSGTRHPCWGEG